MPQTKSMSSSIASTFQIRPGRARRRNDDEMERPAPLACTECRRKHVKCDANVPICFRCAAAQSQCHYLPSRRGLKRRAADTSHDRRQLRSGPPRPISHSPEARQNIAWSVDTNSPGTQCASYQQFATSSGSLIELHASSRQDISDQDRQSIDPQRSGHGPGQLDILVNLGIPPTDPSSEDDDALVNLFYANFHVAHPLLVPRSLYTAQVYPTYLKAVVHFIGSHYSSMASGDALRATTGKALADAARESSKTFHLVQALLLFSIALHARNEIKESVSILAQAVSLALDLGMDRKNFSLAHGNLSSIQEESLRRTWWELYVTDGFMAALQRKTSFRCHSANPDVPLPCDESLYVEGSFLMEPPSLAQFDARIYMEEELHFSSFCYRIEAVRILARALAISWTHEVHEDQVQAIDNTLAAWPHHLGQRSAEAANVFGEVDEMLFQAHMLIQYTIINLHFPRSDLVATVPGASDIIRQRHVLPVSSRTMHGVKAFEASKELGNLAALRVPVQKHTPFFICGVVFSVIVQLSACSLRPAGFQEQCQDRISLITGVLKTLSPTWALSQVALRKIKRMALGALSVKTKPAIERSQYSGDSGVDVSTPGVGFQMTDLPWLDLLNWAPGVPSP